MCISRWTKIGFKNLWRHLHCTPDTERPEAPNGCTPNRLWKLGKILELFDIIRRCLNGYRC